MTTAIHQQNGQRRGFENGSHGTQNPTVVGTTERSTCQMLSGYLALTALGGLTPLEVYDGEAHSAMSFETRPRWPSYLDGERERVERVHVVVKFMDARRHLPIVELKRVA